MADEHSEVFQFLKKLVSFDSVDGNEKGISDFLAQYTAGLGMEVEQPEVLPGRPNIVARKTFGKGGKTVLLNAHIDVVPPADGWDSDPYTLTVREGKAYGRGACDDKGGLACLTIAMKRLIENPQGVNGTILYTGVVDEEANSRGARALVASGVQADYAIIGEPTMSQPAIAHNGSIRPVIAIHGLAAHASNPERGVSAIRVAAYLSTLVDEIAREIARIRHPTTGRPAISITMIQGGLQENVLPDYCRLTIDRRMVPGEDEEAIKARFEKLCADTQAAFPGSRVEIDHYIMTTGPASQVEPDSEIARICYDAYRQVTGKEPEVFGLTCNTDMNHFVRAGIPTVIIGPGTIQVAHQPNEHVDLEQLDQTLALDEAVLRAMLR